MKSFERELKIAIETVKVATEITKWFSRVGFKSFQKQDNSPVTLADYASQFFITFKITQSFPEDQIIAEETNEINLSEDELDLIKLCYGDLNIDIEIDLPQKKLKSERQWTVDPIDGTKGFQKHLSYAIGIGLMINSNPRISIIGVPNFNEKGTAIFIAEKENGAKVSYGGEPFSLIEVSKQDTLSESLMCHSLHYDEPWVMKFASEINITKFIQMDSMAKFCLISNGDADIYVKPLNKERSFSWDFLPGTLLVSEAGGKVSDLNGNPLKFLDEKLIVTAPGLIASNSYIHQEILRSMRIFNFGYK
jgi:3'(2'), 5'-bisphosphate nucleotidase